MMVYIPSFGLFMPLWWVVVRSHTSHVCEQDGVVVCRNGPRDVDVSWAFFCHSLFVVHRPGVDVVRCCCFEVVG